MNIIIVGAGEVGFHIAQRLVAEKHDVVIVDKDNKTLAEISKKLDILSIVGYGSESSVLIRAGIKTCDVFIAAVDNDETNIIACFIAKKFNVPFKIARIRHHLFSEDKDKDKNNGREGDTHFVVDEEAESKDDMLFHKEELGIDVLINPEHVTAEKIFKLITSPAAFEVVDFAEKDFVIKGFRITKGLGLASMLISDIGKMEALRKMLILAIIRDGKLIIPHGKGLLLAGDKVYLIAKKVDFPTIAPHFHESYHFIKRVFIIGVSKITHLLCEEFQKKGIDVKVIEEDRAKCVRFSEQYDKIEVVNCSYTDREALLDEGLALIDSFLAVSDDEEKNILAAMIAKQEKVPKTIASIQKEDYLPLVSLAGIDAVVIPKRATVGEILKHIRRGNVLSVVTLGESDAEIIEYLIKEDSKLIDIPLKDMSLPEGCLVCAIVRGDIKIIPRGLDIIKIADKVIVFSQSESVDKVGKFFG